MDYSLLGQRIRRERKKLSWTQEQLAEMTGVSNAYIGQIERGERNPTLETLVKLAAQLGVSIDYLLQDTLVPDDDHYIDQLRQLLAHRTSKEKQMALDVIKMMFSHLDDFTQNR